MVVIVWVAERILPLGPRSLPALALLLGVLVFLLLLGVEGRLRAEAGVPGAVWEKEAAWALIFERRWVIALGVTSVDEVGEVSRCLFD